MIERLESELIVWLATARPDGRPHLVPIWFVYVDERFWIATGGGTVKVRNLAAQPAVTVALESGTAPVVAEGSARIHPLPYPQPVIDAFRAKYDWDISSGVDDDVGQIALIEVTVARWLFSST